MKKALILLGFFFIVINGFSQESFVNMDSLQKAYDSRKYKPNQQLVILLKLSRDLKIRSLDLGTQAPSLFDYVETKANLIIRIMKSTSLFK